MPAPDVQGLANWIVTNHHLIQGDRMSLYGDNLASATSLVIGGHSCAIVAATTGTFFGYDTITFDVPATLRPNRLAGAVSVSVTNADGTWTSGGLVTFNVARGGDWVQPPDVASTLVVRQFLEHANIVDASTTDVMARLLDPTDPEWVGGTSPDYPDVGLWFAADHDPVDGDTWEALSAQTIFALYEHYWTKTNSFPGDPTAGGALGYETEPQSTQDFAGTGTVNYPATVEMRLNEATLTAEWFSNMTGDYNDNTVDDPPVDWGAPDTNLELRQVPNATITAVESFGAHPRQTATADPVMPADAGALLTSASIEPLVISDFPDRRLTFTVDETDFTASPHETGGQFTFALLLDTWTAESWYGFPPTSTDAEWTSEGRTENRRRVQARIDSVTATATYTPLRYRFVFEVAGFPYIRSFPRDDGLGASTRRSFPPPANSSRSFPRLA